MRLDVVRNLVQTLFWWLRYWQLARHAFGLTTGAAKLLFVSYIWRVVSRACRFCSSFAPSSSRRFVVQEMTAPSSLEKQLILPRYSSKMISSLGRMDRKFEEGNECHILVCPSGFKESLKSHDAAEHIATGIRRVLPNVHITKAPMVDGGEGFTEGLVAATRGRIISCEVIGPVGEFVPSHYGFLGGGHQRTAVIEMAAAAGLSLVPRHRRNPLHTTTYGVGQLIKKALEQGAEKILLGCGDSGTCDGGIGMAQALGAKFFDSNGLEIPPAVGGLGLQNLMSVDLSRLDQRLKSVPIDVACNWHNILCGPRGVARVFGPQKGATPREVEKLDTAMQNVARVVTSCIGQDIALTPGSGASGGLGAGLLLVGAKLHPRFDIVSQFLDIDDLLADCDLVITAEGGIDYQTPYGKVPSYIASKAQAHQVPVIALAGTVGEGAAINYNHGIDAYASILKSPMPLECAIEQASRLLADAAESMMRMVMIGWNVCRSVNPSGEPASRSSSRASRRGSSPRQAVVSVAQSSRLLDVSWIDD